MLRNDLLESQNKILKEALITLYDYVQRGQRLQTSPVQDAGGCTTLVHDIVTYAKSLRENDGSLGALSGGSFRGLQTTVAPSMQSQVVYSNSDCVEFQYASSADLYQYGGPTAYDIFGVNGA
jgi:hypothetical protein